MKSKRPLTDEEKEALNWVKINYRNWRKRWGESRDEHNLFRPDWISYETWNSWYDYPFENKEFNGYVRIIRHLLLYKII